MATIKEIAQAVGVSSAAVSRVLNYDDSISVSPETRAAIFETAERLGYKKKVIYPKIENAALLYWPEYEDELEDIYYQNIKEELLKQAKKTNIVLQVIDSSQGMEAIPRDLDGFVAIGWLNRKQINRLYKICKKGVFIGTSPDEKLFDAVRPNLDSFVTQIVDYFMKKKFETIGFLGGTDRNIDDGQPSMDIREWSFRQSAEYYKKLDDRFIYISKGNTVAEGYRIGREMSRSAQLPRAVCVACDTLAVGLLQAFQEEKIPVPEQVAVFSINDVNVARYVSPPLTTFHIDIPIICETALDLLRNRVLKGGRITKSIFVNGTPVIRKSC